MPDKFRISLWDDARIRNWAGTIGKYTAENVGRIFEGVCIKEQGNNPVMAVLRLNLMTECRGWWIMFTKKKYNTHKDPAAY